MVSRLAALVIGLVAASGCEESGTSAPASGSAGSAVAQAPAKNPNSGFSADLAKKLDTAGTGTDTPERTNNTSGTTASASADVTSGSADAKAGGADPGATEPAAKPADAKSGSANSKAAPVSDKPSDKPIDAKAGSATPTKVAEPVKPVDPPKQGGAVSTAPKVGGSVVEPSKPAVVSAELKAININLLPNWERDVEGAGTISFVVKIPGKGETATFKFHYGIEDAKAPADRDAYKKWLADQKLFTSKDDRQKGVAWYLEGVDGNGRPAFRMVVQYGGKKLICYGSLYKESSLGDLRDQTIIQAKQICETLTL